MKSGYKCNVIIYCEAGDGDIGTQRRLQTLAGLSDPQASLAAVKTSTMEATVKATESFN